MNYIFLSLLLFTFTVLADDIYPPLPPIATNIIGVVSITGTVDSNVLSSALPTGASTETKQDTGNTSLSGIDSSANSIQSSTSSMDSKLSTSNSSLSSIDSKLTSPITVTANQGGSWTVTADAGTNLNTSALALAATQTDRSQKTQLTDGTRDGTIKAASTAAIAADTSLVTALSPNSPLPPGSNTIGALTANQSVNLNQYGGVATTLGQKVMASSLPVTVASDQSAIPITVASLPLPAGAATEATLTKLPIAQGAATAGQSGVLSQVKATDFDPAYTENTINPLTTSTNGYLRVGLNWVAPGSTSSGQFGPIVQGAVTTAAPSYTTGQTNHLSLTTAGALRVDGSGVTQPVSGTVTANQGGAPWTATVTGTVTANAGTNLNTSALALSATQTDRTQFTKLTDGTRDGTIKAASTAAIAADTSLVVALSPNTPLPAGSNTIGALTANQSVNVAQMNGVAVSMGAGTTGTGVQRVVLPTDQSAIPVAGDVANAAADSGNPVKGGAVYNATLTNYTTGNRTNLQSNLIGELAVRPRNKYSRTTGNATTVVKSGAGVLGAICFATVGANSSSVTIYDNTAGSGTIIGVMTPGSTNNGGQCMHLDVEFSTGLTIVTANSASNDVTVMFQ